MAKPLDKLNSFTRGLVGSVQRGVREGLSIRRIGDALRNAGGSISNATLAEIVAAERKVQSYGAAIGTLRSDRKIDPRRLPEALTRLRRDLSFTVEVVGKDQRGRPVVQHVTISSDRALSPDEIMEAAEELATTRRKAYGMTRVESVTIVRGVRAGAAGTF